MAQGNTPIFDDSGRLCAANWSKIAWIGWQEAARLAGTGGAEIISWAHLLCGLSHVRGSVLAENLADARLCPTTLEAALLPPVSQGSKHPLPLNRETTGHLAESLLVEQSNPQRIRDGTLSCRILDQLPIRAISALLMPPLSLNLKALRMRAEQCPPSGIELPHWHESLPVEDWTAQAQAGEILPAAGLESIDSAGQMEAMKRTLFRRTRNHLLVTGLRGVGKTSIVRELARQAALGKIPFLQKLRFLRINCESVAPEDSRSCFENLFGLVATQSGLVLCLDGLAALLRRSQGTNKPQLLAMLNRPASVQVIGILTRWEFNDLLSHDAELLEHFTRIEIDEPSDEDSLKILQSVALELRGEYDLEIPPAVIKLTESLARSYILNEYFPKKGEKLLRSLCEDLHYERTQTGSTERGLAPADVIQTVSRHTGIPESTLAGAPAQPDYEGALASCIFGQQRAIASVATELRLISSGLVDSTKPASVLLFAGMTGVGKTELAKAVAELYSVSRKIQTYPMGNFTEPHSVSGIIGVPPGYVGHEHGGRLINDLNSDPYSVFLLDEAEKAHPNIWIPFLNLFDEGWIIDQRGVKAHADRAIFVLTTNAGSDAISQMVKSGNTHEEIEERLRTTLGKIRHERSSQPVFTPQFLARIKRIVVFGGLQNDAMQAICQKLVLQLQASWLRKREKQVDVATEAVEMIARRGHWLNEKSGGREGGRIIRKLLSDLIDNQIQLTAIAQPEAYQQAVSIQVVPSEGASDDGSQSPSLTVHFCGQGV